jgi:hypothetical protein
MRKIYLFIICSIITSFLFAQDNPTTSQKKKIDLSGRSNDHLMIQLGYTGWNGKPDSINTKGFSRSFNVYFLFDFPFKTNPHLSAAVGPGIASDHIFFEKTYVGIKDLTSVLKFSNLADTSHFKKTKLATAWLELPVELRYTSDPINSGKSFKAAIGLKVGTLLNAHTRSKDLQNKNGQTINQYVLKESSKKFFNTNHFIFSARAGYGHLSIYYSTQLGTLFKTGAAAEIRPYSIGLTLSGL